jgi:outer membrane protein
VLFEVLFPQTNYDIMSPFYSRFLLAASLLFLCPARIFADDSSLKTACVSMVQLMQEYHKMKTLTEEIEVAKEVVVNELQKKQDVINKLRAELTKLKEEMDNSSIADERRKVIIDEHMNKFQAQTRLESETSELIGRRQRAFTEKYKVDMVNCAKEIREVVVQYAKAENYDFVFDKTADSANGGLPIVMFSKDAVDVTSILIKEINKNQPAAKKEEGEKPLEE